ncbi:transposase [Streptomyces viridochromogenes]|uniref:transposase n=1 Tax=Streptomyces viridochromogenes TaxID=1938 RepID=UPI001F1DF0CF|nr:transposase [Streptomyces viridochromogenes]
MLVHLRHGATHDVPACWFAVDRSTITRAVGELRPLLAERGCTVSPGMPLQTLAEVVDHLGVTGTTGIVDGTEIRVRRPAVGRKDRDKSIGGKSKQNAVKTMVVTDEGGRVLFLQPDQARKVCGHHARPPVRAGQAPDRRRQTSRHPLLLHRHRRGSAPGPHAAGHRRSAGGGCEAHRRGRTRAPEGLVAAKSPRSPSQWGTPGTSRGLSRLSQGSSRDFPPRKQGRP